MRGFGGGEGALGAHARQAAQPAGKRAQLIVGSPHNEADDGLAALRVGHAHTPPDNGGKAGENFVDCGHGGAILHYDAHKAQPLIRHDRFLLY